MAFMSTVRFNCVQPGLEPNEMQQRYWACVEMAHYADEHGVGIITLEEHHGADNGWLPSPLVISVPLAPTAIHRPFP